MSIKITTTDKNGVKVTKTIKGNTMKGNTIKGYVITPGSIYQRPGYDDTDPKEEPKQSMFTFIVQAFKKFISKFK